MDTIRCSEGIENIAPALMNAQKNMPVVGKTHLNKHHNSKYATLADVIEACRAVLFDNGIIVIQTPMDAEPMMVCLITRLYHLPSKEWIESVSRMPFQKSDPQAYGSALTYARRYALCAIAGIVCKDDDDDGNAGSEPASPTAPLAPPANGGNSKQQGQSAPQQPDNSLPPEVRKAFDSLPKLDKVQYESVPSNDGKFCFVAKGVGKKDARARFLAEAKFVFNDERGVWWRYANAA